MNRQLRKKAESFKLELELPITPILVDLKPTICEWIIKINAEFRPSDRIMSLLAYAYFCGLERMMHDTSKERNKLKEEIEKLKSNKMEQEKKQGCDYTFTDYLAFIQHASPNIRYETASQRANKLLDICEECGITLKDLVKVEA